MKVFPVPKVRVYACQRGAAPVSRAGGKEGWRSRSGIQPMNDAFADLKALERTSRNLSQHNVYNNTPHKFLLF